MTTPVHATDDALRLRNIATELVNDFDQSQRGLDDNLAYYESTRRPTAVGLATPPKMRNFLASIGWSRTYINAIEERLDVEGFRMAGASHADDRLWHWWQANRLDERSGLAHTECLIHGRAFVVVSHPDTSDPTVDPTVPVIDVLSPTEMYVDLDRRTGKVLRAVRVQRTQLVNPYKPGQPDWVTVYLPNETAVLMQDEDDGWRITSRVVHDLGIVPVVPLVNRARIDQVLGASEITEELRSVTDAAARVMMNMQTTAELMAVPQRILFGIDPDKISDDPSNAQKTFQAYIARILAFEDEGSAQQFAAAELRNFTEVLQELTKQAATYTGLPPQYLSFASDNPASADAIRSSESRLVKHCERKTVVFGGAWEQVMRIAMLIMDGTIPPAAFRLEAVWRNPATPTYAAKADAVVKLATAMTPDGKALLPVEQARIDMGYSVETRNQMRKWDQETATSTMAALLRPPQPQNPREETVE